MTTRLLLALPAALALVEGCAPKKPVTLPEVVKVVGRPLPSALSVEAGDQRAILTWKTTGEGLTSGFNIYIAEDRSQADHPYNSEPYPGDINPDDSVVTYEAEHLSNGVKYSARVRITYPDLSVSSPSARVTFVCGPRGEIELPVRYQSDKDGFSMDKAEYVRADASKNDLYFYTAKGEDFLASPSRLDGFLRSNRLTKLSFRGNFQKLKDWLKDYTPQSGADKVTIAVGDWILIETVDNRYGVIKVLTLSDTDYTRVARLFYAFCPLAGELSF